MKKRVLSLLLALTFLWTLGIAALAARTDTGFSDVAADAWYADAAEYVRAHGLMSGATKTTFSPNTTASRAMLVTILHRRANRPTAMPARFSDVAADAWYADAASWAATTGVVSGYADGRFGAEDPVTREQLVTILWRASGSPSPTGTSAFADQAAIASYAVPAVAWAREEGMVSGDASNRFVPQGNATRAELAVMLHRWLSPAAPTVPEMPSQATLVAYFSCTGSTRAIAETLAQHLSADLYAITPAQPYSSADLNYRDSTSRSAQEQNDPAARPALGGEVLDLSGYDRIYLGYPLWFGQAPKVISTFLERHRFGGKTIIPFCTSGSSAIGSSADNLHRLASDAIWLEGYRFDQGAADHTVTDWADRLAVSAPDQEATVDTTSLRLRAGSSTFTVTIADNDTALAFAARLPMTLSMSDLNRNEKFAYLPDDLPANSQHPETIHAGDLMLFGTDCLVLFYETFSSTYSYTQIGHIDDPAGLAAALGQGDVDVHFQAK